MVEPRNPYNPDSELYRKLTKLLSGPIAKYKQQSPTQLKRIELNKFKFNSLSGHEFRKESGDLIETLRLHTLMNQNRIQRYTDFSSMEFTSEIASALTIYADEITYCNSLQKMLRIDCPNVEIKDILHTLFYDILNIECNLFGWVRATCKMGDHFVYLDVDPKLGVKGAIGLPAREVERLEGLDKTNPTYVQFQWNSGGLTFENWQVAHFRLLGSDDFYPYGMSVLSGARRIWRSYTMLSDAVISYRLVRCLHGESKIWTEGGYKEIKDIKVGEKVYSIDGDKLVLSQVTDWVNNGKQQIWTVSSKHRKLRTNSSHPILVKNGLTGVIDYVNTSDLKPGLHQLVLPKKPTVGEPVPIKLKEDRYEWFGFLTEEGKSYFLQNHKHLKKSARSLGIELEKKLGLGAYRISQFFYAKNKIKGLPYESALEICKQFEIPESYLIKYPKGMYHLDRLNFPTVVDEEFARFFGFMVGDGFMSKNKNRIGFATGVDEDQNQFYANIFKKYDCSARFHHDKRNNNPVLGRYECSTRLVTYLFEDMGFTHSTYTKSVPQWLFKCSDDIKKAFLIGLADADGHYRTTPVGTKIVELQLCNKQILEGVKELCHQVGWNVSKSIKRSEHSTCNRTICGVAGKFKKPILVSYYLCFSVSESPTYENILEVEPTEEYCDVFDICVNNDLHNFIADGCVVHNSPERRVFYIDVGNIDPDDVEQYVQKVISSQKRHTIIDENSGAADMRHRVLASESDFYIPIRGNQTGTRIETLPGGAYTGDVDDLKLFRDQLFSALMVPASYLSQQEGNEDKTSLAQKDLRFARTIQRIQRQIVAELTKIAIVHLFTLGFRGNDLLKFDLSLNNPSKIAEMQELEYWNTKLDVASSAKDFFSTRWISTNILGLTEEEWLRIQRERQYDAKMDASMEAISSGEGGSGGLFGDEGNMNDDASLDDEIEELPDEGISDIETPEEGEPEKEPETGDLLTAPAKRESEPTPGVPHITPRSKGKAYTPVMVDKRPIGAKRQHNNSLFSKELSGNSQRNLWKGMSDLNGLTRGITEENLEKEILNTNYSVKLLLETLGDDPKKVAQKITDQKNKKAVKEDANK